MEIIRGLILPGWLGSNVVKSVGCRKLFGLEMKKMPDYPVNTEFYGRYDELAGEVSAGPVCY